MQRKNLKYRRLGLATEQLRPPSLQPQNVPYIRRMKFNPVSLFSKFECCFSVLSTVPKFCEQCGTKFAETSAKFCSNCGQKRRWGAPMHCYTTPLRHFVRPLDWPASQSNTMLRFIMLTFVRSHSRYRSSISATTTKLHVVELRPERLLHV